LQEGLFWQKTGVGTQKEKMERGGLLIYGCRQHCVKGKHKNLGVRGKGTPRPIERPFPTIQSVEEKSYLERGKWSKKKKENENKEGTFTWGGGNSPHRKRRGLGGNRGQRGGRLTSGFIGRKITKKTLGNATEGILRIWCIIPGSGAKKRGGGAARNKIF